MSHFWYLLWYRVSHWLFQWRTDSSGDIALVLFKCLALVKYKEHTIIYLAWSKEFPHLKAGKWQGYVPSHDFSKSGEN